MQTVSILMNKIYNVKNIADDSPQTIFITLPKVNMIEDYTDL